MITICWLKWTRHYANVLTILALAGCQPNLSGINDTTACQLVVFTNGKLALPATSIAFRKAILTMPPDLPYYLRPAYWTNDTLDTANVVASIAPRFDFEPLWLTHNRHQIGYVGVDYRRLRLRLDFALRDCNDSTKYWVRAHCMVDSQETNLQGYFQLTHARQRKYNQPNKLICSDQLFVSQGLVLGEYYLTQYPTDTVPLVLRGVFLTNWLTDEHGRLRYNKLGWDCDNDFFNNNSFVGTWNKGKVSQPCHWGDLRVYDEAHNLDIGAGFFSPNVDDYPNRGWESLSNTVVPPMMDGETREYIEALWEESDW